VVRNSVCISHQRNSGYKAEQVKYHDAKPLKFPLPFSLGWALTRLQASG